MLFFFVVVFVVVYLCVCFRFLNNKQIIQYINFNETKKNNQYIIIYINFNPFTILNIYLNI